MTLYLFSFIINIIESFSFPVFLSNWFGYEKKFKFIILSGIVQIIILYLFIFINNSGILLSAAIIVANMLSVYLVDKNFGLDEFFIIILYNGLIVLTTIFGFISELFFNCFSIISTSNTSFEFVFSCIIAKISLILITGLLLIYKNKFLLLFNFKQWGLVVLFEVLMLSCIILVSSSIISETKNYFILFDVLIILIIMLIFFIGIIYKINCIRSEQISQIKLQELAKYNKNKIATIRTLRNEIEAIDHRMFYILFRVEHLIKERKFLEAIALIENYKNTIIKYKLVVDTGNVLFDCFFNLKINDLVSNGNLVKTCLLISKSNFYENIHFIELINKVIDLLSADNNLDLDFYISEVNDIAKVEFIFMETNVDLDNIESIIDCFKSFFDFRYVCKINDIGKIVMIFKLVGDFDGEK